LRLPFKILLEGDSIGCIVSEVVGIIWF